MSAKEMAAKYKAEVLDVQEREAKAAKIAAKREKREAILREKKEKEERERWEKQAEQGYWFRVEKEQEGRIPCLQHKQFQHHPLCVPAQTLEDVYRGLGPLLFAQLHDLEPGAKYPSSVIGTALRCEGGSGHGMSVFVHAVEGSAANDYSLNAVSVWVHKPGWGYQDGDRIRILNPNAATAKQAANVPHARHAEFTLAGDLKRVVQGLPGRQDSDWVIMRMDPETYTYSELTDLAQIRPARLGRLTAHDGGNTQGGGEHMPHRVEKGKVEAEPRVVS